MRRVLATLLAATLLSSCGGDRGRPAAGEVLEPEATSSPEPRIAAYRVLVEDVDGFFAAAMDREDELGEFPSSKEELLDIVGYRFAEGVGLAELDPERERFCFTGPGESYLTFGAGDSEDTLVRRTLGTGTCDHTDGDVVMDLLLEYDETGNALEEQVVKGAALVDQVPELHGLAELFESQVTRLDVPATPAATEQPGS